MSSKLSVILILISISLFFPTFQIASSVTARLTFDKLDAKLNNGNGYKHSDNEYGTLAWGESYIMMGYISMYEKTREVYYLDKLADHIDNVLNKRDDVRGIKDYRGLINPCWINISYSDKPRCYLVHSGMITYPIAKFVYLVYNDRVLWYETTYDGRTYREKADLYLAKIEETVEAHNDQWRVYSDEGYYISPKDYAFQEERELPLNHSAAMGRTLVFLYRATGKDEYLDKIARLAYHIKKSLHLTDNNSYIWNKYGRKGEIEDISHAAIVVDFAIQCYLAGIVFTEEDMRCFANTFFNNIYIDSQTICDYVDGEGSTNSPDYQSQIGRWLNLTPYNPSIYSIVKSILEDYQGEIDGSILLTFANLARWEMSRGSFTFHPREWDDQGDKMQADTYSANISFNPPNLDNPYIICLDYISYNPTSLEQWNGREYIGIAKLAPTEGRKRSEYFAYHPDLYFRYNTAGVIFQFRDDNFQEGKGIILYKLDPVIPPAIVSFPRGIAKVGEVYNYDEDRRAKAIGDEPILWSALLPVDLRIDPRSGKITWIPRKAGKYRAEIIVENDAGATHQAWLIEVKE